MNFETCKITLIPLSYQFQIPTTDFSGIQVFHFHFIIIAKVREVPEKVGFTIRYNLNNPHTPFQSHHSRGSISRSSRNSKLIISDILRLKALD